MSLSIDDVKALLVALLPPGSESLYALRNSDNIGGLFYGISKALKTYGTDRLDVLRLELNPSTMTEKIPDWEEACGLTNTLLARFGTATQRRNAVLSVLRFHSSFSLDDIRAAVEPYLGYFDPTQIVIEETDRDALRLAHTYVNADPVIIGVTATGTTEIIVLDDPEVSSAGATVTFDITGILDELAFTVTAPDGREARFAAGYLGSGTVVFQSYTLFCRGLAGAAIRGTWQVTIFSGGGSGATMEDVGIFVEGLGVNYDINGNRIGQGLGAAIYEFAVVVDHALLGAAFDLNAAARAIQTIKPAHVLGSLVIENPVAGQCAIPDEDETIPNACLPC